jgi:hypothetical protein
VTVYKSHADVCWASGQCGFPTMAAVSACADSDHDGMPDVFEDGNGLDKNDAADGRTVRSDGYTNLERYLNGR